MIDIRDDGLVLYGMIPGAVHISLEEIESGEADYAARQSKAEESIQKKFHKQLFISGKRERYLRLEEYQIRQLTGFCTQEIEGYKGFVFCSSGGTVTIPQEVNRAIHTIVANYNEEETAKAKKERREPFLLSKFSAHHLRHRLKTRFSLCKWLILDGQNISERLSVPTPSRR